MSMRPLYPSEPEMVLIPASVFLMGSAASKDKSAFDSEKPQRSVFLPDYYIAQTPVTNGQYGAFVDATGHRPPAHWKDSIPPRGRESHPVVYVSWADGVQYCYWLGQATGNLYRLPSEAEWEKAARGTDGRVYPWGDQWNPQVCNSAESEPSDTTPVGTYPDGASLYGVLDMAGGVWEWTRRVSFSYPNQTSDLRDDVNVFSRIVLRGGSFCDDRQVLRCACRGRPYPDLRDWNVGFRICVVIRSPSSLGRDSRGVLRDELLSS
jgi:formylglycine-generating enzyme required for sulfatase activity